MKKYVVKVCLIVVLGISTGYAANAQFVRERPVFVFGVRPVAPGPRHVWVEGEWQWRGGRYVPIEGYWGIPPAYSHRWIPGHWNRRRAGWFWIPGHWR